MTPKEKGCWKKKVHILLEKGRYMWYIYWTKEVIFTEKKEFIFAGKERFICLKRKADRFNRYFVLQKGDKYANQGNT